MPAQLKPSEIVRRLNEHVIGQEDAKRTLAVAVYAHFRRMVANARRHCRAVHEDAQPARLPELSDAPLG